jgi:preprotein translocase subunit YajC
MDAVTIYIIIAIIFLTIITIFALLMVRKNTRKDTQFDERMKAIGLYDSITRHK